MHQENINNYFNDNIGLVRAIVKKMDFGLVDKDDLFQAGCFGLFKALKKYDERYGKLSSYAVPFIVGEIKTEIRNSKLIKLPDTIRKIIKNIDLKKSVSENALLLNESKENVLIAIQNMDIKNLNEIKEENINFPLDDLEYIERKIIVMKFIYNYEQHEIASRLSLSQSTVSRILKKSLNSLRAG
ncbi:sigma-70 family RNA polymerase sigma factor [Mycoplasmatota bacterium zrk1]